MKKTKLSTQRVLECVTASNAFEGLQPSEHSDLIANQYITGQITGEEAISIIKEHYSKAKHTF